MKIIGQRLRELRQSAKLSQARVATLVGTHQPVVARYESGEANVPSETLVVLADYYDVSLDYIFGRTDNPHGTHYEGKVKIEKAYVFVGWLKKKEEIDVYDHDVKYKVF